MEYGVVYHVQSCLLHHYQLGFRIYWQLAVKQITTHLRSYAVARHVCAVYVPLVLLLVETKQRGSLSEEE